MIPPALHFLFSFQGDLGGVTQRAFPDVMSYLKVVMQFLFGFGFAFLLPVLMMLLERAGVVGRKQLVGLVTGGGPHQPWHAHPEAGPPVPPWAAAASS